ncbi:MAG: serine hydrolase [Acidobacteria bacterium]|nr:serine hydrolase [Acidobacteriota bacterium]
MTHEHGTKLRAFLNHQLGVTTPSFSALVLSNSRALFAEAAGFGVIEPERHAAATTTLYDLASLTKPLATALLALRAHDEGLIDLESPVEPPGCTFTMLDLLRHEAGFPAWAPLYGKVRSKDEAREWLLRACPREKAGESALYSDLGYILLGFLLEEKLQGELDALVGERLLRPLGLGHEDVCFRPLAPKETIAAAELDGAHEAEMARRNGAEPCAVPEGGLWGVVHDGNARFLNGVAGHAGLFATARGVACLAQSYFPGARFLSEGALALAWKPERSGQGEVRTAGWKSVITKGWTAGSALPRDAMGHEGFTGTGVWLEPEGEKVYILLTNRIHPRHPGTDFGPVRAGFLSLARALAEHAG